MCIRITHVYVNNKMKSYISYIYIYIIYTYVIFTDVICKYIYITYIYTHVYIDVNLNIDICMIIHTYVYIYVYIHVLYAAWLLLWPICPMAPWPRKRNCPKVVKCLGTETG